MLDKVFGLTKLQDESSIIESLLEHVRIDDEEILMLDQMVLYLCQGNTTKLTIYYEKIKKIKRDSKHIFEHIENQIIHSDFNHQKQYDLLRTYQRIEGISIRILSAAQRLILLSKLGPFPMDLSEKIQTLSKSIMDIHHAFEDTVTQYQIKKTNVIKSIHRVVEIENVCDTHRTEGIEMLYHLGNSDKLPMGTFRAIEAVFEHLESLGDSIEDAALSLEWLLIK